MFLMLIEKTVYRFLTILFPLLFLLPVLKGQSPPRISRIGVADGLSDQSVNCIFQDSRGFLWVGTANGLNRYDGYSFTIYEYNPTDTNSLSSNWIRAIEESRDGYLWIGTENGLNRYDPDTESFRRFYHEPKNNGSPGNSHVYTIFEDSKGRLWTGTREGGLGRYDSSTEKFENIQLGNIKEVQCILEDEKGALWIGTWRDGLLRYQPDDNTLRTYQHSPSGPASLSQNSIRTIFQDSRGRLWIGTYNRGLSLLEDAETGRFRHYQPTSSGLAHESAWAISEASNGKLWVGTYGGGLHLFDPQKEQFTRYQHRSDDPYSLSNDAVRTLFKDREGLLWIGTNSGLNRLSPHAGQFRNFQYEINGSNSLSDNAVWAIHHNGKGQLWIGTFNGLLNLLNLESNTFQYFPYDSGPDGPHNSPVYAISGSRDGSLWVGTFGDGLHRLAPDGKALAHYRNMPGQERSGLSSGLSSNEVLSVLETSDGTLWAGTYNGLHRLMPKKNQFRILTHIPGDSSSLSNNIIWALAEGEKGTLWLGTNGGLNRLDTRTERSRAYLHHPQDTGSLAYNAVRSIYKDSRGRLWVGTRGGLSRFVPESESFVNYHTKDGLPSNIIYGILEDGLGRLWLSTTKGISCFDPEEESFRNYDERDGLQGFSFNVGAYDKNPVTNELYFGGENGMSAFHPDSVGTVTAAPPIAITSIRYYRSGEETQALKAHLPDGKEELRFSYHDHIITFEFAALSFDNPSRNRYAYRLKGFNSSWVQLGTERKTTFTNLSPGEYVLEVKGANSDGVWNEEGSSLAFTVLPPWWRTPWALGIYFLSAAGLLWLIYRWRTQKQRHRIAWQQKELEREREVSERLRQVDKIKDQFLANTSHELRTPLQGIIGLSEALLGRARRQEERESLSMIISSGKRLNSLINDILDFSKLKNYGLELQSKPVGLHALADVVLRNNAPLASAKGLKLINHIPHDFPAVKGDEGRLQQILFNLVGNAIKFTSEGQVLVSARVIQPSPAQPEGMAEVMVEDTGIGFSEDKKEVIFQDFEQGDGSIAREFSGTGLGLSISRRLTELHGGKMWAESVPGKGSSFYFTLPLSEEKAPLKPPPDQQGGIARSTIPSQRTIEPKPVVADGGRKIHILVADDEPINQQVLKSHLSPKYYKLTQALNGEEAIQILESGQHFDLVLLDVMMPRMSGYEVCQRIRQKYLPSELPIIMVTAKNQVEDLVQGLGLGANDYLSKPFSKEEFLARIKTHIDLHRIFDVAGRFIPNEFIRSLGRSRITEVELGDFAERKVTVFFSDIRDYTTMAESMTPEENYRFVNAFNGRMGPIIKENHGFVNQYLGDAIMAIFPINPADALQAAIGMHLSLREYNKMRSPRGRAPVRVGMGLHTGSLIMGIIGDEQRMDAATISDTVNTASRIENLTKHYGTSILFSEDSLSGIEDRERFHYRYLGRVLVKGKKEPTGIYECFDGDSPEQFDNKMKTLDHFQAGLHHFLEKELQESMRAFEAVLHENPDDLTAQRFLNKVALLISSGIPEGWTGVELMESK